MSTSALPALAAATNPFDNATRPIPRRTYGRQRPASPPPDDEPTTASLFSHTKVSPAKGLLNKWSAASTAWRDSLADWDAPETNVVAETAVEKGRAEGSTSRAPLTRFDDSDKEEDREDEVDMEEAKREMERMRREMRGEAVPPPKRPSEAILMKLSVPKPKLGVSFSSSSLTDLPTSTPPSSPPKNPSSRRTLLAETSSELLEETIPIRKSGFKASGRVKRVVQSSDEEEDEDENNGTSALGRSRPAKTVLSSPAVTDTESTDRKSRSSASPTPRVSRTAARNRQPSAELEEGDDRMPTVQDFFATLVEEEKSAEPDREVSGDSESSKEPVGLFDDEEEDSQVKGKFTNGKKLRSLNKKEHDEMLREMARYARSKPVEVARPDAQRMPISSWVTNALQALREKDKREVPDVKDVPSLYFGRNSPRTSPSQTTPPDDIVAFTPSSDPAKLDRNGSIVLSAMRASGSSPTPAVVRPDRRRNVIPSTSDDQEDEEMLSLPDLMKLADAKDKADAEVLARKQALNARKAAAMAQLNTVRKPSKPTKQLLDSDDEFEVRPDSPPKAKALPRLIAPVRRGPDARAILRMDATTNGPAISKQRQAMLRRAGKSGRPREDTSETYLAFAGKAFAHVEMKNANHGAQPAGQKKGRDVIIAQAQLDAMIRAKHQSQISKIAKQKEEEWGRKKSLPARQEQDMEKFIEMSTKIEDVKEDSQDEDGDDGEFQPERDDVEAYSGESEAEEGSDEDEVVDSVEGETTETDKENQTPQPVEEEGEDEDEPAPIVRRSKPRASNRLIDSDDERDVTPRKADTPRAPLAEVPAVHESPAFDLAGFGSGGSPGFSQLFEATQAANQLTQTDGLAQLRGLAPVGLLPAHALLPGVNITETQAERDNALIAAEVDAAIEEQAEMENVPKPKYLNTQGFFTQTKPVFAIPTARTDDEISSSRRMLGGRSDMSFSGTSFFGRETPMKATSSPEHMAESIPTQEDDHTLTRLKRRESRDTEIDEIVSSPRPQETARNAFDQLMFNARAPVATMDMGRKDKGKMKSNFVDEQAEESDEDNGWLPVSGAGDDEENDEEEDGYVPDLVDDKEVEAEERRRQDELAAAKAREVQQADDAKREAEAKKITEGQYRTKRRGIDFYSDDEDDEDEPRRLSKKQRRKRMLGREDGLDKLDGEENVFRTAYENDLESDEDMYEEPPLPPRERSMSPLPIRTGKQKLDMLREVGRRNRERDLEDEDESLDRELGFGFGGAPLRRTDTFEFDDGGMATEEEEEEESQFSIARSRSLRMSVSTTAADDDITQIRKTAPLRNTESYAAYVRDESQITRRTGGPAGVSVISSSRQNSGGGGGGAGGAGGSRGFGARPGVKPAQRRDTGASSTGSGSILLNKGSGFQ